MPIRHLFFDIGGVLGNNGWDSGERAEAVRTFGLDAEDFDRRHREVVGMWEAGRMSLDEYLDHTVFDDPRMFTRDAFAQFMLSCSRPSLDTIALAGRLAATGRYRMATLNNESEALNVHRIRSFALAPLFEAFYSSCWLGVTKPARRIYDLALAISQADPAEAAFIDDRVQNLAPARALGFAVVHFTGVAALQAALAALGVTI